MGASCHGRDGRLLWSRITWALPRQCLHVDRSYFHLPQARDCWAVAFGDAHCDTERCVAAGYDNGDVRLFCLRTNRLRWGANLGDGVCGLQFDRRDIAMNKLVATCLEGRCHVFDMRTQHPKEVRTLYLGHATARHRYEPAGGHVPGGVLPCVFTCTRSHPGRSEQACLCRHAAHGLQPHTNFDMMAQDCM